MKSKRTVRGLGVVLAVLAATLLSMGALFADTGQKPKVTYVKKSVFVRHGKNAERVALKKNDTLGPGDIVETEKGGRVEIRLADGSAIRLGSRSRLEMQQVLASSKGSKQVSAKLCRGKAYAAVAKLVGKSSSFELKTDTAVAGVRGTAFRINAKTDASTVVRVYSGSVAVSNAPIYAKPGKPKSGGSGKFTMPRQGVKPGGPGRVEVAGPQEVTRKEWEEFVAKAMQEVRVAADGSISAPVAFQGEPNKEEEEWVAWNKDMDKQLDIE